LITPLLATLAIDMIAAYQTVLFVEMIGKCRSFWHVVVLAYGNILVSVALFSLTFPIIVVGLILFEDWQLHKGTIYLQPKLTSQKIDDKRAGIFVTLGESAYDRLDDPAQLANISYWEIDTVSSDKDEVARSRHVLTVLASPKADSQEILSFVTDSFEKLGSSDFYLKIAEKRDYPSVFNLPSRTLVLEVRNALSSLSISNIYRTAFGFTNLLSVRSVSIVKGELVSVASSDIIFNLTAYLQRANRQANRTDVFIRCNDKIERVTGIGLDPYPKLTHCGKWIAISTAIIRAHAASLTGQATSKIFVAPFAWSSLSVTIFVYVMCFILLYAALVFRALLPKMASHAIVQIDRIPLSLAACVAYAFFLVPIAIFLLAFSLV
jgi:hypothetical protein